MAKPNKTVEFVILKYSNNPDGTPAPLFIIWNRTTVAACNCNVTTCVEYVVCVYIHGLVGVPCTSV